MRLLLLFASIASIFLLYSLETQSPHVTVQQATVTQGAVTLNGFAYAGKLCNSGNQKCIKIRGLNATGSIAVAGEVVKKGGEAVLFARSIQ
ncbi:MAG: hypothetical protein Q8R15_02025 [Candidatus Micrarchaeota archaeon]|nr:hypothetical protein [Candidatus Micrarchaeota archaeon]